MARYQLLNNNNNYYYPFRNFCQISQYLWCTELSLTIFFRSDVAEKDDVSFVNDCKINMCE